MPRGTVSAIRYVALSDGWSFTGYQCAATCGSPIAMAPSDVVRKPYVPRFGSAKGTGVPSYRTRTVKLLPRRSGRAGVTTSSWPP